MLVRTNESWESTCTFLETTQDITDHGKPQRYVPHIDDSTTTNNCFKIRGIRTNNKKSYYIQPEILQYKTQTKKTYQQ